MEKARAYKKDNIHFEDLVFLEDGDEAEEVFAASVLLSTDDTDQIKELNEITNESHAETDDYILIHFGTLSRNKESEDEEQILFSHAVMEESSKSEPRKKLV